MAETFPPTTRILLVDDQATLRDLVRSQLRTLGYGTRAEWIKQASSGVEGLKVVQQCFEIQQPIQLVISDWEMPGGAGIDFLNAVRADPRFSTLPFILLTAVNKQEQIMQALQAGVSNYMLKPFSVMTLTEKLQRTWEKVQKK